MDTLYINNLHVDRAIYLSQTGLSRNNNEYHFRSQRPALWLRCYKHLQKALCRVLSKYKYHTLLNCDFSSLEPMFY